MGMPAYYRGTHPGGLVEEVRATPVLLKEFEEFTKPKDAKPADAKPPATAAKPKPKEPQNPK